MALQEARARQMLLAMWDRLKRDPNEALGVYPRANASEIRNAFLAATKEFHPARFARMAPDILSLANEVFLALRAAHDSLARPAAKPPGLQPRQTDTGASQTMRPAGGPPHPRTVTPVMGAGRHGRTGPGQPADRELATILELFAQNRLAAAKAALGALVATAPHPTRYKALFAYARGREAQLDNRIDAAQIDLRAALQLDPDLQVAKTALAELLARRR